MIIFVEQEKQGNTNRGFTMTENNDDEIKEATGEVFDNLSQSNFIVVNAMSVVLGVCTRDIFRDYITALRKEADYLEDNLGDLCTCKEHTDSGDLDKSDRAKLKDEINNIFNMKGERYDETGK